MSKFSNKIALGLEVFGRAPTQPNPKTSLLFNSEIFHSLKPSLWHRDNTQKWRPRLAHCTVHCACGPSPQVRSRRTTTATSRITSTQIPIPSSGAGRPPRTPRRPRPSLRSSAETTPSRSRRSARSTSRRSSS